MQIDETQEMTVDDFFKLSETEGGLFQIETTDGFKDINLLLTKKNKECYLIRLEDNYNLECAGTHLILTHRGWKEVENIIVDDEDMVMTDAGYKLIIAIEYIGIRDCFDFNINSEKNDYLSNGIVSHNSGKSMAAKAAASAYQIPLLRLDFGALFGSLLGESEKQARQAIKIAERVAPCVTGDTKIIFDGQELTIENVFENPPEHRLNGLYDDEIAYFKQPHKTIGANDKGEKIEVNMLGVIKRKASNTKLLKITAEDGKTVTVTENHKLLVKTIDGTVWKEAKDLTTEDDLVSF